MKTTSAIAKGILLGAALIAIAVITGCSSQPLPGPCPLDFPGSEDPTAAELHTGNLRCITGNPVYR
jgi:hypothetical protein